MTYAKNEVFTSDLQTIAELAKAVSHPARWAILLHLAKEKRCISGDISKEIPLGRSTVSQHLQELKDLGLIQGTVEGKNVCYCLNPEKIKAMILLLQNVSQPLTLYLNELNNHNNPNECGSDSPTNCC